MVQEKRQKSWLCFHRLENDFQDVLSNCTLDSLMFLHFKHKFKASSAGVSGYRGCSKCLIVLYDSCTFARLLQLVIPGMYLVAQMEAGLTGLQVLTYLYKHMLKSLFLSLLIVSGKEDVS